MTNKQYADGTTGRLKEKDALWFFQQAVVALDYMHLLVCMLECLDMGENTVVQK